VYRHRKYVCTRKYAKMYKYVFRLHVQQISSALHVFSYYRMCSVTTECVLLLQNVFRLHVTLARHSMCSCLYSAFISTLYSVYSAFISTLYSAYSAFISTLYVT